MARRSKERTPKPPPFAIGDVLDPSRFNMINVHLSKVIAPCTALNVVRSSHYVSGFGVEVMTETGKRTLDSAFFSLAW